MLPRISDERIDVSSGSSSFRFGSSTMVATGSFLDISKSPGKDSLLLSALFSTKGWARGLMENPVSAYDKLLFPRLKGSAWLIWFVKSVLSFSTVVLDLGPVLSF